jgi:hypothetical protein
MPLQKLWNALFGNTGSQKAPAAVAESRAIAAAATLERPAAATATAATAEPQMAEHPSATPPSRRCQSDLRKWLKQIPARSVLEIGVGEGSRAAEVIRVLAKRHQIDYVRYAVIDQFELAGGGVALKDYHRGLRQRGIQVKVFPEPLLRGLERVSVTLGPVDLVLVERSPDSLAAPEVDRKLRRVCHPATVVLALNGRRWERVAVGTGAAVVASGLPLKRAA